LHVQLGDLATWVGSLLTVGVLFVAVWQLEMLRRDRESQQASQVSAWVSGGSLRAKSGAAGLDTVVEISFRNVSTQPIGRLLWEVKLKGKAGRGFISPLPPDGVTKTKTITFSELPVDIANSDPQLDIWFTDEAGHSWHRPHAGGLVKGVPPDGAWGLKMSVGLPSPKSPPMEAR
jgi:hypothetical protein